MLFIFLTLVLCVSCNSDKSEAELERENRKNRIIENENRPLIQEGENGEYIEWYPGHKQMKIKGRKNEDGERNGVWRYYYENGVEQSVGVYTNGKKEGIYIVRYPNNLLRYRGEYEEDEQVGIWQFYDEEGNLIETKNYSEE